MIYHVILPDIIMAVPVSIASSVMQDYTSYDQVLGDNHSGTVFLYS